MWLPRRMWYCLAPSALITDTIVRITDLCPLWVLWFVKRSTTDFSRQSHYKTQWANDRQLSTLTTTEKHHLSPLRRVRGQRSVVIVISVMFSIEALLAHQIQREGFKLDLFDMSCTRHSSLPVLLYSQVHPCAHESVPTWRWSCTAAWGHKSCHSLRSMTLLSEIRVDLSRGQGKNENSHFTEECLIWGVSDVHCS